MKIPKHFPKWDKTTDGLGDAGLWALDCERSRLPAEMLVPRTGQIWETVRDCEVAFRACIIPRLSPGSAAGLPKGCPRVLSPDQHDLVVRGGTARLRQGERVRILEVGEAKPIQVCFVPLRYNELHERIVSEEIRRLSGYKGYRLSVKTAKTISDFQKDACRTYFNEDFRLLEDVP